MNKLIIIFIYLMGFIGGYHCYYLCFSSKSI